MNDQLQILQSLNSICNTLRQGSAIEIFSANLIFIAFNNLKHYWLNIPIPAQIKNFESVDTIEEFLKNCADLD